MGMLSFVGKGQGKGCVTMEMHPLLIPEH